VSGRLAVLRSRVLVGCLAAGAPVLALACSRVDEPAAKKEAPREPAKAPKKLSWTRAPAGDLAKVVVEHVAKTKAEGRAPIVYLGATWCEPCRYFHRAAEAGELDATFGDLAILELDADADKERADKAGYASTYVPLFVVPGADGRGTDQRIAGSIKGPGAVAEITPRLKQMLGR